MIGGIVTRSTGFAWDAVGNRTTRDVVSPTLSGTETYTYDIASNRLVSTLATSGGAPIQSRTLAHGDSGHRSADQAAGVVANVDYAMAYDASDRLVAVSNGGVTVGAYLHNALGQRVAKTAGGATTHYLYDLSGRLIAEADGATGAATAEYIAFEGMPLAHVATGSVNWIHVDHLGTPQVLTDDTGAVVWDADYRPFGEAAVTGSVAFNLRFPGQYYDEETGLHYNYFRTYDPTSGRYLESDPIGLAGGWNTYAYVSGNPVMRVDPRGLDYHKPRDTPADFYVGGEILAWPFGGVGMSVVSCCVRGYEASDASDGDSRTMLFVKSCDDIIGFGISVSFGPVWGLGNICDYLRYTGWFQEITVGPINVDIGRAEDYISYSGVGEAGAGWGFGAPFAYGYCKYKFVAQRILPCGCWSQVTED